jgi:hypothetical protein
MKVLHLSNIANNAYLNAKILNKKGVESDVLSHNYYHIMGCPEWEDADFVGDYCEDNNPSWSSLDLNGFERPDWFVQGSKIPALKYLIAKNENSIIKKLYYKYKLKYQISIYEKINTKPLSLLRFIKRKVLSGLSYTFSAIRTLKLKLTNMNKSKLLLLSPILLILSILISPLIILMILNKIYRSMVALKNKLLTDDNTEFICRINILKNNFVKDQPDRSNYFDESYLLQFQNEYHLWKKLFSYYDIIHAYGLDGIYPLMADVPYIAFEHGTIRNFPFQNDMIGISTYMSYKYADGVFITNADNIKAAKELGLENYTFIPHPINEMALENIDINEIDDLHVKYDSDFIAFHPPRQHWTDKRGANWKDGVEFFQDWEKGNDIFIRGFAKFVKEINPKAKAIFVLWGKKINESKELIKELDIVDNIIWVKPMHNIDMIKVILSIDLLVDQFTLGAFGSTMPKALMCKKPAMIYLDKELHDWCLEEMPPVFNDKTDEEVFLSLKKLYQDKEYQNSINIKSLEWYSKYHSNELIYNTLMTMYNGISYAK